MHFLEPEERSALLDTAGRSIAHGIEFGRPLLPDPDAQPAAVRAAGASFVTLQRGGALRGCMGTLEAVRTLVLDVAHNAFAAAFRDPRFPPLTSREFVGLEIHISVLSAPEPLEFLSEAELIAQLRPGVDGLIVEDAGRRSTFLPAVWDKIRDPREFLRELKHKAGLAPDHESLSLRAWRYTAESVD
jgi:hypothetical protein